MHVSCPAQSTFASFCSDAVRLLSFDPGHDPGRIGHEVLLGMMQELTSSTAQG